MQYDKWQQDFLDHKGNAILCTGRQVGKTTIMAHKAARRLLSQKNCKIIIASISEDQAKLIIVMILTYLEQHARKQLYPKGQLKPTLVKINLRNGSEVRARPVGNTGDALRGFTGHVLILDENSRMNEVIMSAAKPILLTTGGEIWICSTPFGKQGFFWETFKANKDKEDPMFKVFHISSEEVIYNRPKSKDWDESKRENRIKFLENEKETMSQLQYGQEYLGLFIDDLRRLLTDEEIDEVLTIKQEEQEEIMKNADYALGVDIARLGTDTTPLEGVRKDRNNHLIQVYHEVGVKWFTDQTEDRIFKLHQDFRFRKVYIDAGSGSLGVGVLDHLQRKLGMGKVAIAMNNRTVEQDKDGREKQHMLGVDMYLNLLALIQRKEISLFDREDIRLSLRSLQYEYLKKEGQLTRLIIFSPNHAESDIAEALKRAAWFSKEKINKVWIDWV